jgi:hypothetical protein
MTVALTTSAPSAPTATRSRWLLATLCLANFMAALDLFVVNAGGLALDLPDQLAHRTSHAGVGRSPDPCAAPRGHDAHA